MRLMTLLSVSLAILASAANARASAEDDGKQRAKRLVDAGNEHFRAQRFAEALGLYEEAHAAYPSPKILLNLAEAHRNLDAAAPAVQAYERFLRESGTADPDLLANVRMRLAALEPQVSRLELTCEVRGARVEIDGREAGILPLEAQVLAPGLHRVTAELVGYAPFAAEVETAAGAKTRLEVRLTPLAAAPTRVAVRSAPEDDAGLVGRWWFWAAIAAAAAGVVVGSALLARGDDFVPGGELGQSSTADWQRF